MSAAAAVNGGDSARPNPASAPKQQLRSSNSGKALDGARKQAASPVDGQNKKQQAPKAWQGPNPITQRAASNLPNGTEKPPPRLPQQQAKSVGDLHADKHAHDRSLFLLAQFIGKDTTITLKNGEQFTGVFSGASLESNKAQYVIKMARRTKLPSHQQVNGNTEPSQEYVGEGANHAMSFDIQDTANLSVAEVSIATAAPQQNGSISSSFLTDTQISGRDPSNPRERELQRWEPGPDSSIDMSLEASGETGWDQFAVNERMYNVQSTYDENIYTTSIDRSNPEYKRREAEAERIAREIEGSAPSNAHVAEERRRDAIHDGAEDEEDKYSGVRREAVTLPRRAAGAYVPPSQRPMTGAPTVPGAPFDPAIISAQLSKPAQAAAATSDAKSVPLPVINQATSAVTATAPAPSAAPAATAAPKKKENTTEDRVRDTADAFKQFANNEKLRIRQAQEQKRSNARQEKNVKLNDLKKFAANFKLKSRVPDDLVPILAKDREKQLEIQNRAEEAAKEEEVRAKEKLSEKAPSVASPTPSNSTAPTSAVAEQQRTPFNSHNRAPRVSGQGRQLLPGQSPRGPLNQRVQNQFFGRPQPLPTDLRIPTAAMPSVADMPMSPNSATRLNVNAKAFEFRPGANAFTPTGTSPSPHRSLGGPSPVEPSASFFQKDKPKETKPLPSAFDPIKRMAEADYNEVDKKKYASNGGLPQAYHTPPTWPFPKSNDTVSYKAAFPQAQPPSSQGPSPMQTPNPTGQMPHAHQLPPHMQAMTPSSRPAYFQHQQPGHGPSFDPRLQQHFGPNGSVQNSPRAQQIPVAPFNGQMPPMPQFPGQPMPGYGMSPNMSFRQPSMPGGQMMMIPGQQPGPMGPMQPGYPPGPGFRGNQMGGHMMVQQPSNGYVNGPMPQQGFSPMPPHAQPHLPHMQQHGPGGYSGSPRPAMMQHQGSHQGYQPGMQMQPHFVPSPGQPHPYHLQQRAMSGGFPQMTPRQQHAMPTHPSPGMPGVAQGDEGK